MGCASLNFHGSSLPCPARSVSMQRRLSAQNATTNGTMFGHGGVSLAWKYLPRPKLHCRSTTHCSYKGKAVTSLSLSLSCICSWQARRTSKLQHAGHWGVLHGLAMGLERCRPNLVRENWQLARLGILPSNAAERAKGAGKACCTTSAFFLVKVKLVWLPPSEPLPLLRVNAIAWQASEAKTCNRPLLLDVRLAATPKKCQSKRAQPGQGHKACKLCFRSRTLEHPAKPSHEPIPGLQKHTAAPLVVQFRPQRCSQVLPSSPGRPVQVLAAPWPNKVVSAKRATCCPVL